MNNTSLFKFVFLVLGFIFLEACENKVSEDQDSGEQSLSKAFLTEKIFLINNKQLVLFHPTYSFSRRYGCYTQSDVGKVHSATPVYSRKINSGILDLTVGRRVTHITEDIVGLCVEPRMIDVLYSVSSNNFLSYVNLNDWDLSSNDSTKIIYSETERPFEIEAQNAEEYISYHTTDNKCLLLDEESAALCFMDELQELPSLHLSFYLHSCTGEVCPTVVSSATITVRKDQLTRVHEQYLNQNGWN